MSQISMFITETQKCKLKIKKPPNLKFLNQFGIRRRNNVFPLKSNLKLLIIFFQWSEQKSNNYQSNKNFPPCSPCTTHSLTTFSQHWGWWVVLVAGGSVEFVTALFPAGQPSSQSDEICHWWKGAKSSQNQLKRPWPSGAATASLTRAHWRSAER